MRTVCIFCRFAVATVMRIFVNWLLRLATARKMTTKIVAHFLSKTRNETAVQSDEGKLRQLLPVPTVPAKKNFRQVQDLVSSHWIFDYK
jgi:hypothetical protein